MGYSVYEVNKADKGESSTISPLFDRLGKRKYLTIGERNAFLAAAREMEPEVYTFCLTLAYTGARLSEVLALTPGRIDHEARLIVVESLKKRRRGMYRGVPVPQELLIALDRVHHLASATLTEPQREHRIWSWCRTTAWKRVKECMVRAGIHGAPASPKGLRHGLGVGALQSGVPINLVKSWLGHARLATTEVYTNAIGKEEEQIARGFWMTFERRSIDGTKRTRRPQA